MNTYQETMKVCATCAFWAGPRLIASSRDSVQANSNDRSKCLGGGRNGQEVLASQGCPRWQKTLTLR